MFHLLLSAEVEAQHVCDDLSPRTLDLLGRDEADEAGLVVMNRGDEVG